ncbi:hypothetical protein SODALDRAFT_272464 [Sodiomyces alkalinus F11]|uniref:Mixed-linked glucanase n=1 Tax=Sodiomyces alkalinus (strain CBS 110278 / VKM F-3762 / F11) TaxID=1314773 RepID=A0A3N2Q0R5_SODAK|nr:hypothetical protein SODALDRAFT_272464 [Sodiomyces alkalinus F11]ROT40205.1 hypothetical protein SODALDRAFT_272464 [Sodiomyces alkalinus F11]
MAYSLSQSYCGDNFASQFNWFNGVDPSRGFVRYQSEPDALAKGLYSVDPDTQVVTIRVDSTNTYPLDGGRPSVRLESKQAYNGGLFIGDFSHMPPSDCGLWPAFWLYGPDWPANGEVDIIEGVNTATRNLLTAHTAPGCMLPQDVKNMVTGDPISYNCASGAYNATGCSYFATYSDKATYGDGFNAVGGGVYAMDWTPEDIRIWHWPRHSVPRDIIEKRPDPNSWGRPMALFGAYSCEPGRYFRDMNLILQTNFCGDYAAGVWSSDGACTKLAPTCAEYVANNPWAFGNAYWEVNYIDVYEKRHWKKSAEPTTTTTLQTTSTVTHTVFLGTTAAQNGSSSSSGQDAIVPEHDPATIGEYANLGCVSSENGFATFEFVGADSGMTPEMCVGRCTPSRYAGVHHDQCICADELDGSTRATSDRTQCDIPCPGNEDEFCGGIASSPSPSQPQRRQNGGFNADAATLINLYGMVGGRNDTPALGPGLGRNQAEQEDEDQVQEGDDFVDDVRTTTMVQPPPAQTPSPEPEFVVVNAAPVTKRGFIIWLPAVLAIIRLLM